MGPIRVADLTFQRASSFTRKVKGADSSGPDSGAQRNLRSASPTPTSLTAVRFRRRPLQTPTSPFSQFEGLPHQVSTTPPNAPPPAPSIYGTTTHIGRWHPRRYLSAFSEPNRPHSSVGQKQNRFLGAQDIHPHLCRPAEQGTASSGTAMGDCQLECSTSQPRPAKMLSSYLPHPRACPLRTPASPLQPRRWIDYPALAKPRSAGGSKTNSGQPSFLRRSQRFEHA